MIRVQTPSPAHSPVSKVVHVRGLVRPFTVKALHELLRKFGSFNTEKDFWIDNVKSRCIVKVCLKFGRKLCVESVDWVSKISITHEFFRLAIPLANTQLFY